MRDTGPGIAAEDQPRIFEAFQQGDHASTRPQQGTGLGLAIAKQIIEQHGGRIGVRSRPGQGATFWCTIPTRVDTARGGGMTTRILVIEDNGDNREILRDLLTSVGYEILEATTGPEGVCAAVTQAPDLILMDLHLPGLDGYDATRRIKAHPALGHIPIIAVTVVRPERG